MAKGLLGVLAVLVAVFLIGFTFISERSTGFAASSGEGMEMGTPATKLCIDSDGENNFVRGSCMDASGEKKIDRCVDVNTVSETYCSPSNQCAYKYKNCPYGMQCAGGACLKL